MNKISELTIDWDRSILVNDSIDNELVKLLTPKILSLRKQSHNPITVGIDSPGGSLASLDTLLDLLTGPDQDGKKGKIITVAINKAYSAAAIFLAFGNYSTALENSSILYHDVRFPGITDVTPEKARSAAISLQRQNDLFALKLANRVIERLIWVYFNVKNKFEEINKEFPEIHNSFSEITNSYTTYNECHINLDIASFATCLWALLSSSNDGLIINVMKRLNRWIAFTKISNNYNTYSVKGSKTAGLLDGAKSLYNAFGGNIENFKSSEDKMKLMLSLMISEISETKTMEINFQEILNHAADEFKIIESMENPENINHAMEIIIKHKKTLFKEEYAILNNEELKIKALPHVILFWNFCIQLCREIFEGEHILNPKDAQLVGLLDETFCNEGIQSIRDFMIMQKSNTDEDSSKTTV